MLTGLDGWICIAIGGAVVLVYSVIGGMWSIPLADQVQFIIKTIGIFALMLPFTLVKAGGFSGIKERMGDPAFNLIGDKSFGADPADDHHVVRRVHVRSAHRPGHLAARLHRAPAAERSDDQV